MSELVYLHLHPAQPFPEPVGAPFRAMIVAEEPVDDDWRLAVCEWLIGGGCLYVVAWGVDCQEWENEADYARARPFGQSEIPDERFVMTTSHADEPLAEAFWFCGHCAFHGDVELDRTVIVHVAPRACADELLEAYRLGQVLADD